LCANALVEEPGTGEWFCDLLMRAAYHAPELVLTGYSGAALVDDGGMPSWASWRSLG
jgi:hypothetical protein